MDYTEINAKTIDKWVDDGWEWGKPVSHEVFADAKNGKWNVKLTPTKPVPKNWFPELDGKKILGLASGGGQQMPIFAALGGICTVLDYSSRQIESERLVAAREGYEINTVCADMTKPLPFEDETFDMIFHPVSNCYIKDVFHVWKECARIIKPGGVFLCGFDNGFNYLFSENDETRITGYLPFDPLENADQLEELQKDDAGIQFSHGISEQIAGQIVNGFELLDVYDDTNGGGYLHEHGVPTFWATLSRKK